MADIRQMMSNGDSGAKPGGKKKIEDIYQKKTQLEHILLRPDTYIGSVEVTKETTWVYDKENNKMIQREIEFVPGLYKIFDEILVNAADNKQRDKNMTTIKVEISQEKNTISIWNNGQGIPVVMHQEEKMFVPTMIFGHLLTSSNYNDEEQKVTGGRNGYGAKLCNIFSTMFTVETAAKKYKKSFKQIWSSNMTKTTEPKISEFHGEDYTKISFSPDLTKFKMEKLDDDMVALMSRRAFDIAASTRGVSVFLNGQKLPVKQFKDYIDLYIKDKTDDCGAPLKIVYENVNERWEVAATISEKGFQQVSFVNSIATMKGGRHVDYIVDMIIKQLTEILKRKNKGGVQIKPFQVKNHIWVFINCLIVNPTFDSQTKENMTLQPKNFGSKCALSDKFITGITKSGIVEAVLSWAKFKAQTELNKTSGKKHSKLRGIPKLEDANNAGTKNSLNCTLILTEGDSAKSLAVSGLGVVGRDNYGVFPLRGKLLNVREATHKQILENAEINNLIKIVGLQYKHKYNTMDDLKTLRYGRMMIMTDQDQDGSHIKGLLINFIHTNWPELLRLPFLEEFITPIVKAKSKREELSFYSLPEFEEWKANTPNFHTYNVKYYKGLGTSSSKEAKEYFSDMARHRILFKYDGTEDDDSILMAFAKKCVDQRKEWLTKYMDECKQRKLLGLPERYLYTKTTKEVTYREFINLELVLFSNMDNTRSIPCVVDGLKPGQRKVLFTCIKRNDKREVKVAQLAGSVAEKSAYHHGETSLCSTIVNLAQNFVGSNNINLLMPNGQFGTRLQGGKDSASPRYIFTMMSPLTRFIFHPHDDPLLEYLKDDNLKIEPTWYLPIIPMVLVNGCEGIGTGWATKIPNHNPRDIIFNLRRMIQKEEPKPLIPWYKNFKGGTESVGDYRYVTVGNISILGENKIEITELPVATWTQNFKENTLEPLLNGNDKQKAIVTDYKEYHTDTTVRFVITLAADEFRKLEREDSGFHRVFKLTSSISLTQMHAFDSNNCLRRYENVNVILREFYDLRLEYYQKRKDYLQGMLEAETSLLSNQARFILEKCNKTLTVENKKRKVMIDELIQRGYDPDPIAMWKEKMKAEDDEEDQPAEEDEENNAQEDVKPGKSSKTAVDSEKAFQKLTDVKRYNYLLGMSLWMLTEEKKNELLKQRDNKIAELNVLKAKTPESIWMDDLDALEKKLNEVEEKERNEELGINTKQAKAMSKIKPEKTKRGGNVQKSASEIFPAKDGIPVDFRVTADLLEKHRKAAAISAGSRKVKKEKPEGGGEEKSFEVDEFDAMVDGAVKTEGIKTDGAGDGAKTKRAPAKSKKEPGETKKRGPRAKKDDPKQTKLTFKKKSSKGSDDDDDIDIDLDGSDIEIAEVIPAREKNARRAATKKINYSFLLDDDEDAISKDDSDEEPIFHSNIQATDEPVVTETIPSDDSDVDIASGTGGGDGGSSNNVFDSLKDDSPSPPKKKGVTASKKKTPTSDDGEKGKKRPRKKQSSQDDSEGEDFAVKKKKPRKKKRALSDDDEDDDDDSDFAV